MEQLSTYLFSTPGSTQGTINYNNKKTYCGQQQNNWFFENKPEGEGTYSWPNGISYRGKFIDGKKHGEGTLTLSNGKEFPLEFENDKIAKNPANTPALIAMLDRSFPDSLRIAAAYALGNLAHGEKQPGTTNEINPPVDKQNQDKMAKEGAINVLVAMLNGTKTTDKSLAAGVLASLSAGNTENQNKIAELGAIPTLVNMLNSRDNECVQNAAYVIANLCDTKENRATIANKGAIPKIVELLKSSPEIRGEYKICLLSILLKMNNDKENLDKLTQTNVIPSVVALLKPGNTDQVTHHAVVLLTRLAKHQDSHTKIIKAGAIPKLRDLREIPDLDQSVTKKLDAAINILSQNKI